MNRIMTKPIFLDTGYIIALVNQRVSIMFRHPSWLNVMMAIVFEFGWDLEAIGLDDFLLGCLEISLNWAYSVYRKSSVSD